MKIVHVTKGMETAEIPESELDTWLKAGYSVLDWSKLAKGTQEQMTAMGHAPYVAEAKAASEAEAKAKAEAEAKAKK